MPSDTPVSLRIGPNKTVTLINRDAAADVYASRDRGALLGQFPPADQTKIASGGTVLQSTDFRGVLWFRASAATSAFVVLD